MICCQSTPGDYTLPEMWIKQAVSEPIKVALLNHQRAQGARSADIAHQLEAYQAISSQIQGAQGSIPLILQNFITVFRAYRYDG